MSVIPTMDLNILLKLPENQECADCSAKFPQWAVYNHGIFVCAKCARQHRYLGTDISKVKQINDEWDQSQFEQMIGNEKSNLKFLAKFPIRSQKPREEDDYARQKFIQQKYKQKKWMIVSD